MITQELVQELFEYKDGALYWRVPFGTRKFDKPVGTENGTGYLVVNLKRKLYRIHRLIYLYHYGCLPHLIDHINNDKKDNRIENLRVATKAQNGQNAKLRNDNVSGIKGVCWDSVRQKWKASIRTDGKTKNLGRFDDLELAELVIIEARDKYHKEFKRDE